MSTVRILNRHGGSKKEHEEFSVVTNVLNCRVVAANVIYFIIETPILPLQETKNPINFGV